MARMHVMLQVEDLDESLRFYRELFAAEPSVVETDYAKWMLEDPRLNFSIGTARGNGVGIEHLGIQADSEEELAEIRRRIVRLAGTGAVVDDEGETTCCYARSDKTWIVDAQGVSWEAFYTYGPAASYAGGRERADSGTAAGNRATDCCEPGCCEPGHGEGPVNAAEKPSEEAENPAKRIAKNPPETPAENVAER